MKLRRIKKDKKFKYKKLKRQSKLKKRNKKRIRLIRRTILFILFIVSLIMLALSSLFNITAIEVYGNNKIDTDALISVTKIEIGSNGFKKVGKSLKNYFFFRYGNEENSILNSFPYAKKAKVMFCLPNTVRITVEERIPMFFIKYNDVYILIDEEGYVLEESDKPYKNVIFVEGVSFESYEKGQALEADDPDYIQYIKKLLSEIPKYDENNNVKINPLITKIDVGDPFRIKIELEGRIMADLGDLSEIGYRLDFIKDIYFNKLKKTDKGYLEYTEDQKYNFKMD
ncbi:MAG TPA: FtsQ-type POTRA domain-containing protein [Pseudobacteroides sp.]|nr:FtsQ-type POTRA domain-containing protein [Pseudobacteroides sp.]